MSGNVLGGLEPGRVWSIFESLAGIPRPSAGEAKVRRWIKSWAADRGIPYSEDEAGNLLLAKGASRGLSGVPALVLQAHLDMVCQSAPGLTVDFENDPIRVIVDGGFVKAEGTTLGADNGIGVAYALALLDEPRLNHGPLEVLLTVSEETGFTGALGLRSGFITGRRLLNLDSETLGEVTIGSAGGGKTEYEITAPREKIGGHSRVALAARGLLGGHSGVQIHLPRLNALKLILEGVSEVEKAVPIRLGSFDGGSALNAIPAQAECSFLVPDAERARTFEILRRWKDAVEKRWRGREPGVNIAIGGAGVPPPDRREAIDAARGESATRHEAMTQLASEALLSLLREVPHGPLSWNEPLGGSGGGAGAGNRIVRTSNNLALVKCVGETVRVGCLSRSFFDKELAELRLALRRIGEARGAKVEQDEAYPGWSAEPRSDFVRHVAACYEKSLGRPVRLTAVHAGLECGLLTKIYPGLEVASIGPDIANAHSPGESVSIESVQALWRVLLEIVGTMGALGKG